ncbi:cytochrome b/b6 domain-containing protein [Piscinibacter sakaiensis]|uniref:Cytochrome b n=1 Tax=Piscinibacter sakaiensis TaxID=1547922 RepID=A0A0K8NVZ9_PISS1|nr:cytochrome b/b6 domain-containing protein [Piscinibacter sakaiensis]GAP34561.1 cytochrome b [Piscinibacter sakaiensis]
MTTPATTTPDDATRPVRVWDLPTRVFHWLLAAAIVGCVITGQVGGGAMVWHFRLGETVLALLVFRLLWGFLGGRWSRFASFLYAPATVWRYLRGGSRPDEHHEVGHNPLGAFSVWAMLGLLAVQVGTGLVADDEIANLGPLNRFVETATGLAATSWHKGPGKLLIIVLVLLHVAAIVYYLVKKRVNLVRPMWHGDKPLPAATPASADHGGARLKALLLALLAGGLAWYVGSLGT